jgi:hypothetical protein
MQVGLIRKWLKKQNEKYHLSDNKIFFKNDIYQFFYASSHVK